MESTARYQMNSLFDDHYGTSGPQMQPPVHGAGWERPTQVV